MLQEQWPDVIGTLAICHRITGRMPQEYSPLTLADRTANDIIVKGLESNFSEYAILSEESRDNGSRLTNDYCFIVDPLDGTKEFVNRNGQFTVNIALSYRKKAILGVIYVPVTKQLYYVAQGHGVYFEMLKPGKSGNS